MRKDGSFWLYDGGHRCRASFYRDDITELPCMVFKAENEKTEAKAFIGTNTMQSVVSAYHKHRAAVLTEEPIAVVAQSIIEKNGYQPCHDAHKKYGFGAINTLHQQIKIDERLAEKCFAFCAAIAQDGEPFSGVVLDAIFICQKKLEGKADIFLKEYLDRLKRETITGIEAAIRRQKIIAGAGGSQIAAKGILDLLNKGKRNKISFV